MTSCRGRARSSRPPIRRISRRSRRRWLRGGSSRSWVTTSARSRRSWGGGSTTPGTGTASRASLVALTKGPGPLYDELDALRQAAAAPTAVHRFFASLPPQLRERRLPHQLLVTTSYDLALEQALLDAGEEFDVVSYLASGRDCGPVLSPRPQRGDARDRAPEHVRAAALARAAHRR